MEEIKEMLKIMQIEMKRNKMEMLAMKEELKNTIINNINEKFTTLEAKNEQLEQKVNTQKVAIDNSERYLKRKNILLFGVEEQEHSYQELEEKVQHIINNILKVKCEKHYIESVRRLGIKNNRIRPIVITLLTMGLKIQILKNKKNLETTSYYIKEDYPMDILIKRKELQIEVEILRKKGEKAIIKYDKIILLKNKNQQMQLVHNKKRMLSESPEQTSYSTRANQSAKKQTKYPTEININSTHSNTEKQSKRQPVKINKSNSMNNFVIKQPMLILPEATLPQTLNSNQNRE